MDVAAGGKSLPWSSAGCQRRQRPLGQACSRGALCLILRADGPERDGSQGVRWVGGAARAAETAARPASSSASVRCPLGAGMTCRRGRLWMATPLLGRCSIPWRPQSGRRRRFSCCKVGRCFRYSRADCPTIIHKKIGRRCVWASRRTAMRLVRYGGELECLRLGTPPRLGPAAAQRARGGSLDRRAASIGSTTFATISLCPTLPTYSRGRSVAVAGFGGSGLAADLGGSFAK